MDDVGSKRKADELDDEEDGGSSRIKREKHDDGDGEEADSSTAQAGEQNPQDATADEGIPAGADVQPASLKVESDCDLDAPVGQGKEQGKADEPAGTEHRALLAYVGHH